MSIDVEGYGFPEHDRTIGRLMSDIRTLSQLGVERVAEGWERHGERKQAEIEEAERVALHALENANRFEVWDEVRKNLFGLTESGQALVVWQSEHGEIGHKAERAAFAAALGLLAADLIDRKHTDLLLVPMSEALPWLVLDK